MLILDNNRGLCPVDIPGELCIGGDGVTRGYTNREKQAREQFVEHPIRSDQRIYRTGDLARWLPDDRIECLGRIDSQVKLRGSRIELGEIESVLSEVEEVAHAVVNLYRDTIFNRRHLDRRIQSWSMAAVSRSGSS